MEPKQFELTPVDIAQREAEQADRLAHYRRQYWQRYKTRHKRVYGTLTPEEFAELKALANANGRSIWQEIWQQSKAYRNKTYLPSETIQCQIEQLYGELRQVNNQLNRICQQNKLVGKVLAPKRITEQIKTLEQRIDQFTSKPWGKP